MTADETPGQTGEEGTAEAPAESPSEAADFVPQDWESHAERLLRENADVSVVSFPKCGRTWLSLMATSYIARSLGEPEIAEHITEGRLRSLVPERERDYVLTLMRLREEGKVAPLLLFLHKVDYFLPYFWRPQTSSSTDRNIVLVRDPRDVVVSFYHHIVHKNRGRVSLKPKASVARDTSLPEFIYSDILGFRRIVRYMSTWIAWANETGGLVIHYEDLVAGADAEMTRFLRHSGIEDPDPALIEAVVRDYSFDTLRRAEKEMGKERIDPALRRMRKGKIGGFRDEVDAREVAFMDAVLLAERSEALDRYRPERPENATPPDASAG